MLSEKTKLKLLDMPTRDLIEVKTLIDNELDKRHDKEINMIEFDTIRNGLMNIYKSTPIHESMIKAGST